MEKSKRKISELDKNELEDIKSKNSKIRKRVFNIMQYERHKDGEELINEEQIKKALSEFKDCEWAYIVHDKDNIIDEKGEKTEEKKPKHFHIVLRTKNPVNLFTVAKRFDIMPQQVDLPKGFDAFADCLKYLTHEDKKQQKKGKHLYSDEEIISNFDFRKEINEMEERRLNGEIRKGVKENKKATFFKAIRDGEMSLKEVEEEDEEFYFLNERQLKYFRNVYIQEKAKMPIFRLNFYIYGQGGVGKDIMSRALARSLCPELTEDKDIFFYVGSQGSMFDGYDGQPVIIWSDYRAIEILKRFDYDLGTVLKIFDTTPTEFNLNIKYGKVRLINKYNIVNSVQPYKEFLDGLVGEYTDKQGNEHRAEDKRQSYRRFPVIIPIKSETFDVMINKRFIGNSMSEVEYNDYYVIKDVIGNFVRIAEIGEIEKMKKVEMQTLRRVTESVSDIMKKLAIIGNEKKEIIFENYGKEKNETEEGILEKIQEEIFCTKIFLAIGMGREDIKKFDFCRFKKEKQGMEVVEGLLEIVLKQEEEKEKYKKITKELSKKIFEEEEYRKLYQNLDEKNINKARERIEKLFGYLRKNINELKEHFDEIKVYEEVLFGLGNTFEQFKKMSIRPYMEDYTEEEKEELKKMFKKKEEKEEEEFDEEDCPF